MKRISAIKGRCLSSLVMSTMIFCLGLFMAIERSQTDGIFFTIFGFILLIFNLLNIGDIEEIEFKKK